MGECQQDDFAGFGTEYGQKLGDPTCQRRRFSGTGGGQNTEILGGRTTDNARLFIIQCKGSFCEGEPVTHSFNIGVAALDASGRITEIHRHNQGSMWEVLILITVILGIHWWEYTSDVQEYTFAQPATLDRHDDMRALLGEKTPLAVEIGALPWRPEVVSKSSWPVDTENGRMTAGEWLEQKPRPVLTSTAHAALAEEIGLPTGLIELDSARRWWWLPQIRECRVDILEPGEVNRFQWIKAERQWVGCSHGGPLTLWLVHARYRRYLQGFEGDPWSMTVAEVPWIGRIQYIEVTVKPGWCIGLPAHWGFAIKTEAESWVWTGQQHSALSLYLP